MGEVDVEELGNRWVQVEVVVYKIESKYSI